MCKYCLKQLLPAVCLILWISSCGSVKHQELLYLDGLEDSYTELGPPPTTLIQTDDVLDIQVTSRNPENVIAFQPSNSGVQTTVGAAGENAIGTREGYRVDEKGLIYLPFLGPIIASGKTVSNLRDEITEDLSAFIPDATIQIRFLNFRVTLLGEFNRPNTYTIPNEKLTILEAIGIGGDLTNYANRDNVVLIRERNERREVAHINLTDKKLLNSPYYYLSPNDLIYVEPLKAKQYATTGDFLNRYGLIIGPVISFFSVIAVSLIINN